MSLPAAADRFSPRWHLAAAIGISLLAAGLRLCHVRESLWLDELHTAWCAVGPLAEVAQRGAIGNQGPLFFWLEWLMLRLFGPSELALRLLSIASGSLVPLAVFLFARRWKLDTAGLVAAGLVAVDPLSIFYATEARPYGLLQLMAVIHMALTAEAPWVPTLRWRFAWIGLAVAMFYLHFTAALILFAEAVFLGVSRFLQVGWSLCPPEMRGVEVDEAEIAERRSKGIPTFSQLFVDLGVVSLVCLMQLSVLQYVFAHNANWTMFVPRAPFWAAIHWFPLPAWWWGILVLLAIIGMQKVELGASVVRWFWGDHICALVGLWLAIPLAIAWLTTWTDLARLFYPRYLVCVLPGAGLFAGLCVFSIPWTWARGAVGVATVACALWNGGTMGRIVHDGRVLDPRGEDWRGAVSWLNEQTPQTQFPVLVASGLIEADALRQPHDELLEDYCLLPVTSLYPLGVDRADMFPLPLHEPETLDQVVEMLVVHRGGVWLIVRGDRKRGEHLAVLMVANLKQASVPGSGATWQIRAKQSFGRVQVLLLTAAQP
jgi:mannosyltransferase